MTSFPCKMPLGRIFSSIPLSFPPFPTHLPAEEGLLPSGWPGRVSPGGAAVLTARWVPLALWLHCSLFITCGVSLSPHGTACLQHIPVSLRVLSLLPLLSPGHPELQGFCLPLSVHPSRHKAMGSPLLLQPPAARAVSGRQNNPPNLFQPQSPCWEPTGLGYLTSAVQKGCSFQKGCSELTCSAER